MRRFRQAGGSLPTADAAAPCATSPWGRKAISTINAAAKITLAPTLVLAAQQFGQQSEDRSTNQWTEHRLGASEQNIEHDRDALMSDVEILRLDKAEVMRIEATANADDD